MDTHDPDERFKPGGGYRAGFTEWEFDEADRLVALKIQYSPFFKDGEADSRAKVERALEGKIGQSNEYLYDWDEEGNKLAVRILPPLPIGIPAQPWKVAEIEYVLGFTDPTSTARLIPVQLTAEPGGEVPVVELAPVVWRHGRFAAEPHLLVAGVLGSGKSNLLRSLAAQALGHGHLVTAIDAEHTGHFDEFSGRDGVLRVESAPAAAMDLLDWVCAESTRRAERLRELGDTEDTLIAELAKPLWLFVDELAVARRGGGPGRARRSAGPAGRPDAGRPDDRGDRGAVLPGRAGLRAAGHGAQPGARPGRARAAAARGVHGAVRRHAGDRRAGGAAPGTRVRPGRRRAGGAAAGAGRGGRHDGAAGAGRCGRGRR